MNGVAALVKWLDVYLEEVICAISLSAVALCVFAQFVVRCVFGSAMAWPEEVAIYGMVWAMYMGASMCVREKAHMRILLAVKALPYKMSVAVIVFADFTWLVFNLFMVVIGIEYIELLVEQPMISPALGIDQRWPQSIIPIGFGLMAFRIIEHYYYWFKEGCPDFPA